MASELLVPSWITEEADAHARAVEAEAQARRPRHPLVAEIEDAWPPLPSWQEADQAAETLLLLSLGEDELRWWLLFRAMTTPPSYADLSPECPTLDDVAELGRLFVADEERRLGVYRPEWAEGSES